MPDITLDDVNHALAQMKNDKVQGEGNVIT